MEETFTPDRAQQTEYPRERPAPRPDRFAFWAVVMAVVAMFAGLATADAGASDGGIGTTSGGDGDRRVERKSRAWYRQVWEDYSDRNHRWARRTSECESGGDPNAIGGGGAYRGAFQFMRSTWRHSPKTPGGDPIDYNWKTQAVVAIALKKRDGTGHWPVCG